MDLTKILTPESTALLTNMMATVLLAVITAVAASVARVVNGFLKAKFSNERLKAIESAAGHVVLATEQLGLNGLVLDKKAEAELLFNEYMKKAGINLSAAQVSAAIEAAVLAEINFPAAEAHLAEKVASRPSKDIEIIDEEDAENGEAV